MIDKKGKLFGKLNIIDLLVIIVILAIVAVVGYKVLENKNTTSSPAPVTTITYTVLCEGINPEIYENVLEWLPNDQLMASGELLPAYVTDVTAVPHQDIAELNTTNGVLLLPLDGDLLDLTFTITATVSSPIINEVGTQEVRIGKTHIVKTQHFELATGTILSCEWTTT